MISTCKQVTCDKLPAYPSRQSYYCMAASHPVPIQQVAGLTSVNAAELLRSNIDPSSLYPD